MEAEVQLDRLRAEFRGRHLNLDESWLRHFEEIQAHVANSVSLSPNRRLLVGAYFSGEYAIESAALFNPSIVAHPDQTNSTEQNCASSLAFGPAARALFPPF